MDEGKIVCKIPSKLILKSTEAQKDGMEYCDGIKAIINAMTGGDITPYGRCLLSVRGQKNDFFSKSHGTRDFMGLHAFATENRNKQHVEFEGVTKYEWESLWQYYDVLQNALSVTLQSDVALSNGIWNLGDDWWVKDGSIKAADDGHHYVLPSTLPNLSSKDEL